MNKRILLGLCAGLILGQSATAANLAADGTGQVLLFPYMAVSQNQQTLLEIHNNDRNQGTATRVVFKDHLNGRPLAQLNVYLGPGDSWTTAAFAPIGSLPRLIDTGDSSCTVALNNVYEESFAQPQDTISQSTQRLTRGWIEVYQMGMIPADLASDCDQLTARNQVGGSWFSNGASQGNAVDVTPPTGSLTGWSTMLFTEFGDAYQVPPIVIESFSDRSLHFSPNVQNRPNLSQVNPAVSTRQVATSTGSEIRTSTWTSLPIHAIDALLMSTSLEGNYSVNESTRATSLLLFFNPTRPYHGDVDGFYLNNSVNRVLAPFTVSNPPQPGESTTSTELMSEALNREGVPETPSFHSQTCTDYRWAMNEIFILRFVGVYANCSNGEGAVLVRAADGHIIFDLEGQPITSDEGHIYQGQPSTGYLLEAIRFDNALSDGSEAETVFAWTRTLNAQAPTVE